jgi:hypothetical protein
LAGFLAGRLAGFLTGLPEPGFAFPAGAFLELVGVVTVLGLATLLADFFCVF